MLTELFIKKGRFYLPYSAPGWVVFLIYAAVNVQFFLAINRNSHSVSDTLIHFFVYFMALSTLYWWITYHTEKVGK